MNKKNQSTDQGFTFIELLIIMFIIGVLSTIVVVSLSSARKKGRDARRISDINSIQTALEMYYEDNKVFPACEGWIHDPGNCLTSNLMKYLDPMPLDPSEPGPNNTNGQDYGYRYWKQKKTDGGGLNYTPEQSYTILANTERPHNKDGYRWGWADGVYDTTTTSSIYDNGDVYYYAVAGS